MERAGDSGSVDSHLTPTRISLVINTHDVILMASYGKVRLCFKNRYKYFQFLLSNSN
jgi:hypothetical protein